MAKPNGPLMSQNASGKIGERLVFSVRKSGQQVRFQRAQKDVITAGRTTARDNYKKAYEAWNSIFPFQRAAYKVLAIGSKLSGYNLYVRDFIALLATGFGVTWTERRPVGDVNANWLSVASDADGSHLIAGDEGGRLYTSIDYGLTWTERRPAGDVDKDWRSVASDADGSHLIACVNGGRLYTSDDFGVTWTERRPVGDVNANWWSVASDADGSHLIAGVGDGRLYTSDDFGVTWTERRPVGDVNANWRSVASDADGSHLIAGYEGGRLYTSP